MTDVRANVRDQFIAQLAANQRRLYQYIFTLVPRPQDADDVMQDTLVVLWEKIEQFDAIKSFYAWAKRVAYLQAQNHRRRNKRLPMILDEEAFELIAARIDVQAELLQARQDAMTRCAEKLAAADHLLFRLRYQPGATVKAVARQLGRSADSVRKSLGRIRRALWDCINAATAADDENSAREDEP
jgi:RNA polymerase sigma-70 factor (ECF subfamily)